MYRIESKGPNRLDLEFSGKLNSDDMQSLLDELIQQSEGVVHGRMLYRIGDFQMPTLGAVAIKLSHMPDLFRLIHKFDRIALVVERSWLQKASELESKLIPGLEIKAFDPAQETAAEHWLAAHSAN